MEKHDYIIIDEPGLSPIAHIVLNPLVILFATLIIPIIWNPPALGRFWMPYIWLLLNGYALNSATWAKEWVICIAGIILMCLIWLSIALAVDHKEVNATWLLCLYYAVFTQSTSYELFEYMREKE